MKKFAIIAALALIPLQVASAAEIEKRATDPAPRSVSVKLVALPGKLVKWRSARIGPVNRLGIVIGGRAAAYATEARTHACVAYAYQAGVALRLTDCVKGRRVPFVRVRIASAALKPVRVALRFN